MLLYFSSRCDSADWNQRTPRLSAPSCLERMATAAGMMVDRVEGNIAEGGLHGKNRDKAMSESVSFSLLLCLDCLALFGLCLCLVLLGGCCFVS